MAREDGGGVKIMSISKRACPNITRLVKSKEKAQTWLKTVNKRSVGAPQVLVSSELPSAANSAATDCSLCSSEVARAVLHFAALSTPFMALCSSCIAACGCA